MKKILSIVAMLLALVMCLGMFAACDPQTQNPDDTGSDTSDGPAADEVTVCWYEGSKLLKEEYVKKGSKLTPWTPTSESGEFKAWYAEASKTELFDFETVIEADTDLFAAFKTNVHEEDTNNYYLIGTGSGNMKDAAWDHAKAEAALSMTKETVENANVYKITITMYAGDRFQICYGGAWDGQVGIGLIAGAEYCDGVNEYDSKEYTAADKKVAQVKDAEGNVVFVGSDEYNKSFDVWNIILAEGMDGKYEFTYTTYPNDKASNQITWKLVEKVEPLTETHKMQLVGSFNSWDPANTDEAYAMKKSEDGSTWSAFVTVTKAEEFKVVNQVGTLWYGNATDGGNIVLPEAGTYAVKYTVEGNVVAVEKCEYYLVGTFVDGAGQAVNFSVKKGVTPALTQDGNTLTGTVTATDVTAMGDFSWIAAQGKPGVFAIKVVLGSELGIKDWYGDESASGDNWYLAAGTYTITFDLTTKTLTKTAA